jgi:uncharacterized membrane protein
MEAMQSAQRTAWLYYGRLDLLEREKWTYNPLPAEIVPVPVPVVDPSASTTSTTSTNTQSTATATTTTSTTSTTSTSSSLTETPQLEAQNQALQQSDAAPPPPLQGLVPGQADGGGSNLQIASTNNASFPAHPATNVTAGFGFPQPSLHPAAAGRDAPHPEPAEKWLISGWFFV